MACNPIVNCIAILAPARLIAVVYCDLISERELIKHSFYIVSSRTAASGINP